MTTAETCPHCNATMQGEPIPESAQQHKPDHDQQVARYGRCYCRPWGDLTHFSRVMGHEIQGVYDGVLFYSCPDCGLAWPRWTDGGRLTVAASDYASRWNAAIEAAS